MATLSKAVLVAMLALACPAFAQIFPGIEREEVLKRGAESITDGQPENPANGGPKVDGAAVRKRYDDILTGYLNAKSEQKKAYAPFTDKVHDSVRRYAEALAMLRLGYYEDAAKTFDGVGYAVKKDAEIKGPPELRKVANDIKAGKAYYFRMIAVVMQDYREFKDEAELDAAWTKTRGKGQKIADECLSLVERKRIDETAGKVMNRQMEGWLGTAKGLWRRLMEAENRITQRPHEAESWVALINATGATAVISNEVEAPCYLKRRAAARVLKEFWPEASAAVDGTADIALAMSHFGAFQFDDYGQYLVAQAYHSASGKAALDTFLEGAQKHMDILQKLKGE